MEVDPSTAPKSVYKGTTYYFMDEGHKQLFNADPEKYLNADK
jgi:YHS domain-containing protein